MIAANWRRDPVDLNSYLEFFGALPAERGPELEGKVLAAIQRNGDWEIIAVEEDREELEERVRALGVDPDMVVFHRVAPPQFSWNGDEP